MDIVSKYFSFNKITKITPDTLNKEQILIANNYHNTNYFDSYFQVNLDIAQECLEYDIQLEIYDIIYTYIKQLKINEILEPCCSSGIFGNFLANIIQNYTGIDINKYAIEKAKQISKFNNNNANFSNQDIYSYNQKSQFIIGRYFLNTLNKSFDMKIFNHLCNLSDNFLCILNLNYKCDIKVYQEMFENNNFDFQIISKYYSCKYSDGLYVIILAKKNVN